MKTNYFRRLLECAVKLAIPNAPQTACVINFISFLYFKFFSNNPFDLAFIKGYLLPINAYAFGIVMFYLFIQPRRKNANGNIL